MSKEKEILKYATKEIELFGRRRAAVEAIEAAEQAAGIAVLDAPEGESTAAQTDAIMRAKSEVSAIDAAVRACRQRRLEAIKRKRAAEAVAAHEESDGLRSQIESINSQVSEHLAAVAKLEQTQFAALPLAMAADLPLTQCLQMQIDALERRATALESEVPRTGGVDVSNVTGTGELIAEMLKHEGDVPTTEDVLSWVVGCEKHGRPGQQTGAPDCLAFGALLRNFHLVWRDCVIDFSQSYTQVPELIRASQGVYNPSMTVRESGSDLFRCPAPAAV